MIMEERFCAKEDAREDEKSCRIVEQRKRRRIQVPTQQGQSRDHMTASQPPRRHKILCIVCTIFDHWRTSSKDIIVDIFLNDFDYLPDLSVLEITGGCSNANIDMMIMSISRCKG